MQPSSFSGWGIRTVATTEARYNPMSYHNGSVWPHDNAMIAAGIARYGYRAEAAQIFRGLFEASTYIDLKRLPELFCGFPRVRSHGPTFYPVACSPQAWAATATLSLLRSCLGISFDPENDYVVFDQPVLPRFVDDVTLRQLRLGRRPHRRRDLPRRRRRRGPRPRPPGRPARSPAADASAHASRLRPLTAIPAAARRPAPMPLKCSAMKSMNARSFGCGKRPCGWTA